MKKPGPCGTCWHWRATGDAVPPSFSDYVAAKNRDHADRGLSPIPGIRADELRARHAPGRLGLCERRLHPRGRERRQPVMLEHGGCGEHTPRPAPPYLPASCFECKFFATVPDADTSSLPSGVQVGRCIAYAPLRDGSPWHPHPAETLYEFPRTQSDWRCGDGISLAYEEDDI